MKINPVSIPIISIKNNNQKNFKTTNPVKAFDDFDTLSLSFGRKQKPIGDEQEFDFKKEFGEIKKALKSRSDFSLKEKRTLKATIRGDYFFEETIFKIRTNPLRETREEFCDRMQKYTDFAREMIQNKRLSGDVINDILRIASSEEKNDIEKLLIANEEFPPERIVPFILSASELNCDWGKIKEMLKNGEFSEEKLIQDTMTLRLNRVPFYSIHLDS